MLHEYGIKATVEGRYFKNPGSDECCNKAAFMSHGDIKCPL